MTNSDQRVRFTIIKLISFIPYWFSIMFPQNNNKNLSANKIWSTNENHNEHHIVSSMALYMEMFLEKK